MERTDRIGQLPLTYVSYPLSALVDAVLCVVAVDLYLLHSQVYFTRLLHLDHACAAGLVISQQPGCLTTCCM